MPCPLNLCEIEALESGRKGHVYVYLKYLALNAALPTLQERAKHFIKLQISILSKVNTRCSDAVF